MAETMQHLHAMRGFYNTCVTRTKQFRKEQLQKLKSAILKYEQEIQVALYADLKKSAEETWVTETGFLLSEINSLLKNLHSWMKPERVPTNLVNFPSSSYILREPLGVVLIIGPWNYPLQLLFTPLAGAIAAGNCVVLKASEFAPATGKLMEKIITEIYPPEFILFDMGDGATVVPQMMNAFRFDHVFYTGSTGVGRIIYQLAADKLVPVTLELGGKSPCVVEDDANLSVAARRIAMTKFSNAGQMCVAPDYVLVHQSVKKRFLEALIEAIRVFFTADASTSYNFGKIIHEKQFKRLINFLSQGKIVYGGHSDASKLYIEPTVLDDVMLNAPVMQEEIFGPILPVIGFNTHEEARQLIDKNPNPLAFYIFTSDSVKEKRWLNEVAFGGGCVNNASWHLTNHHLPFGGRGNSGLGAYHGKSSFEVFSHKKSILKTPTWFDPSIKYPPFEGKLGLFKKVIR